MSIKYLFTSSVGKKQLVGLTGLGLSGFVLMHMSGNMLILCSAESYNKYSHALISNPLLPVAEIGLVVLFAVHIIYALLLARANHEARPIAPYQLPAAGKPQRASFASRTMVQTGVLTAVFLGLHLWTFKYGAYYPANYGGVEMRDLHRLVVEKFSSPLYAGYYIFSMVVLFTHLSHGVAALCQSLGITGARNPRLRKAGYAFAAIVALGFISQPLFVLVKGGH